jgi:hypothetical protein
VASAAVVAAAAAAVCANVVRIRFICCLQKLRDIES